MNTSRKLITAPTVEPVDLGEMKGELSINDPVQDTEITSRIKDARAWAENYTERSFNTQTWEIALNQFCDIELPRGPVQSITSVTYFDSDNTQQTLDSAVYELDDYGHVPVFRLAPDQDWPSVYDRNNAIKIRYVAGYGDNDTDVPEPIRRALKISVGHWVRYQALAESGVSITRIPFAAENLLNQYRIYSF